MKSLIKGYGRERRLGTAALWVRPILKEMLEDVKVWNGISELKNENDFLCWNNLCL
jgi:hypothetical protein